MTLKEKFKNIDDENKTWNQIYDLQEQIADNYAIEFVEWLNTLEAKYLIEDMKIIGELNKNPTAKELLEIFKKKGL